MIDQSLLQSNFIGRDGFKWWVGQIPPIESNREQSNGGGWGNRTKVRIFGYHPYNTVDLSNDDLPWAQVLLPTTSGSGGANYAVNPKLRPGDIVLGFFLDGDNGQTPVIIGCFGKTSQVPSNEFQSPFVPFTGYTSRVARPNGNLYPSEQNEDNAKSQKSPRDVPPSVINKINSAKQTKDEIPYFTGVGKKVVFGSGCHDTAIKGIIAEVTNLLDKSQTILNSASSIVAEVNRSVEKIVGIANNIVGQMFNSLYKHLIPILQKGLDILYKQVYAKVLAITQNPIAAHLAGVAAQTAMVPPVKLLEEAIPCVASKIVNGLSGTIKDLLNSVLQNVSNFVTCAGTQFAGTLINSIIDKISSGLSGVLNGVSKILSGGFNLISFLRSGVDVIKSLGGLFDCNQSQSKCSGLVKEWTIGQGNKSSEKESDIFQSIVNDMNNLSEIGSLDIFKNSGDNSLFDPLSNCYVGKPTSCGPPQVKIFGGGGSGAVATAILGSFVYNTLSDGTITNQRTASIIGARVDSLGSGYRYPPFVEFVDNCNQGYGAYARSEINENGEVVRIYMVSEGENYPVGDVNIDLSSSIAETTPQNNTYGVIQVAVIDGGSDYLPIDFATDDYGNRYNLVIEPNTGSILFAEPELRNIVSPQLNNVQVPNEEFPEQTIIRTQIPTENVPINTNILSDLPIIKINSKTGVGAILKPIIGQISNSPQGELKIVVDCIT